MLLIDDRTPPPPPGERPVWDPNWPMWGWIAAAVGTLAGAAATAGLLSVLLAFAAVACAAQAAVTGFPDASPRGLHDHRQ